MPATAALTFGLLSSSTMCLSILIVMDDKLENIETLSVIAQSSDTSANIMESSVQINIIDEDSKK